MKIIGSCVSKKLLASSSVAQSIPAKSLFHELHLSNRNKNLEITGETKDEPYRWASLKSKIAEGFPNLDAISSCYCERPKLSAKS